MILSACSRGNQVRILSDPVTVFRERYLQIHCIKDVRREDGALICKSGNLLNRKR